MKTVEHVATYKGRPVTEMTREELIEAYTHLSRTYTEFRQSMIQADELSAMLASVKFYDDAL